MTSTATTAPREANVMQGVGIMAFAMVLLPCMDVIAKYMANVYGMSPGQVTFYRFFFHMLSIVPLLFMASGKEVFRPRHPWLNLLRGAIHGLASLFFFAAVKYMPLADAFAIYFVEPFILTAMSAFLLGERVGWRRWLAIVVGFGGALIVIQPSFALFGWTAVLPIVCAFLYSIYLFMNRALGDADSPLTMQTIAGFGGTIFISFALFGGATAGFEDFQPSLPSSPFALLLLVVLGSLSGYGHMLVVRAFRLAPISLLAPFQYFEIIAATVLGYALFGDFPTASKWLGIAIIVASGLFIIWREQKARKAMATMALD